MAKKESSFKNMFLTLLVISLVASLALGSIYNLTRGPIETAKKAKQEKAIRDVMPEFDSLVTFRMLPGVGKDSVDISLAYKAGQKVCTAVATFSKKGYNATPIQLMVGILPDQSIYKIAIVQQKETPGLGTKMTEAKFKDQFTGKNPAQYKFKVKKDGGDVDAISAATISSRAFCDAVQRAYEIYNNQGGNDQ